MSKSSSKPRRGGLLALAAAILAAGLSASCVESAPAGPTVSLVPREAIAAAVVDSPYKLYGAAEDFWKSAGLDAATGQSLKGLLEKSVSSAPGLLESLDFARPWALAVLPAEADTEGESGAASLGKGTRLVLYVPYRSSPEEAVEKLGGGSLKVVAKAKGYLVLSDTAGAIQFPPARGADLSRLGRYPASSIKFWGDPAAIRRAAEGGFKPVADAARRYVTDPEEPEGGAAQAAGDPAKAAKALQELCLSFLSQLDVADASVELGRSGFALRIGASSARGSDLRKILASASKAPSALEWASQADAGALFSASWSSASPGGSDMYRRLIETFFSSLGLPPDLASHTLALRDKWGRVEGPRGAMSLDMDLDAAAASAGDISKAIRIKYESLRELRDQEGCRALMAGFPSDPDFLAFSGAYEKAFGISLSLENREPEPGTFRYGELGVKLSAAKGGPLDTESGAAVSSLLGAFGSQLSMRWTISNGRLVATNGDVAALSALANRRSAKKSLAADPAFAAFAKTLPPRTLYVGSLSMRRLMTFAAEAVDASAQAAGAASQAGNDPEGGDDSPKAQGGAPQAGSRQASSPSKSAFPFSPDEFGSWYSYLAVDSRGGAEGLEVGIFIPASDVKAFAKAISGSMNRAAEAKGGV